LIGRGDDAKQHTQNQTDNDLPVQSNLFHQESPDNSFFFYIPEAGMQPARMIIRGLLE
jgi:hypothetical protein